MKSLFKKIIALTLSLAVSFILIEVLLRLVGKDFPLLWMPDAELGWKQIPGARKHWTEEGDGLVFINALGQRDRERQREKKPGIYRIAVFGDSITEANQVNLDKTFCYLLEEQLSTREKPVEVLNFGVSGYSPVQYLLSLKRNGPLYHIDCAVWAIFLDNDVAGCHPDLNPTAGAPPYAVFDADSVRFDSSRAEKSFQDYHRQPLHFLRTWSCIYRFLSETRQRIAAQRSARSGGAANGIPKRFLLYEKPLHPEWEKAWETFEKILIEFKKDAGRQGISFLVLSVPAAQVVNEKGWKNILAGEPAMAGKAWFLEEPENRLVALCRKHSIPLLQAFRAFKSKSEETLFFGNAGHLTAKGNQLMAEVLENHFRESK